MNVSLLDKYQGKEMYSFLKVSSRKDLQQEKIIVPGIKKIK